VISTVTNKGEMRWRIYSGALNAKKLIAFLARLTRKQNRKINDKESLPKLWCRR
jgi:hypothetical protein